MTNALRQPAPDCDATPLVTAKDFKEAMSRFAGAVNIITTDGPAGKAGFTATAVCSVTDTPPTLLVCVNTSSSVGPIFQKNEALCVNTIGPKHESLAMLFGGKTPNDERFGGDCWQVGPSGAPVLDEALVSFDCRVNQMTEVGTHTVLFCEVQEIFFADETIASIYVARKFHAVTLDP